MIDPVLVSPLLPCTVLTGLLAVGALSAQDAAGAAAPKASPNSLIDAATWFGCIEEGKEKSQVQAHLDHLTNRIGPRLSGSSNLTTACNWAKRRFESFGMTGVHLQKWGEFPVGFDRGPYKGVVIRGSKKVALKFSSNAWTPGTKGPEEGSVYLLKKGTQAKDIPALVKDIQGHWVFGPRQSWRLTEKVLKLRRALAKAGALGYIAPAKNQYLYWFGDYHQNWERLPRLPYITMDKLQYEAIQTGVQSGESPRLRFDIRNHFVKGPIPLYNVIAEIRGSEKPEEVIIIGGHLDSWDGATGTIDNGTGAASTLEAARILMTVGARPKRTIRFMLWSAEEQGLLGSKAYVDRHRKELLNEVSAVFVHDGGTNYVAGIGGPDYILPQLQTAFAGFDTIDATYPFKIRRTKGGMGGGSDHASFLRVGIPGFYWSQRGKAVYRHGWHTQYDTFDLAVPEYQRHTATCIALGALAMANLDERLPRWRRPKAKKKTKTSKKKVIK